MLVRRPTQDQRQTMQVSTQQRSTYMEKKDTHSNKHFDFSRGFTKFARVKAGDIRKVRSTLYLGGDGSVFEITTLESGLFQRYRQVVKADTQEEYETCKECSQVHNELANRTYSDIKTSIDVVSELFRKAKVMEPI